MPDRSLNGTFVRYKRRFIWFLVRACLGFSRHWNRWTPQFLYAPQCNSKFLDRVLHLIHGCKWFFKCLYQERGLNLLGKVTCIWLAKPTIDDWFQIRVFLRYFICFVRYACHPLDFGIEHGQALEMFDMCSYIIDDRLH